jgi:hypothetical protein
MDGKACVNCSHVRCLFYGEMRSPVYNGNNPSKVNCWDNAKAVVNRALSQQPEAKP